MNIWRFINPSTKNLRIWLGGLLLLIFVIWHVATKPGLIPPIVFENDQQAAFFFGEPLKIFSRIWAWFVTNADIYQHLWVTLLETVLAFGIGTALGLGFGLWLALSDRVVVLSAGPASHPIGEFEVDLKRPRDVAEVRATPRFIELHQAIWSVLREEVLKGYRQQLAA